MFREVLNLSLVTGKASVLHCRSDLTQRFHDSLKKFLVNVVGRIAPTEFGTVSKQDLMFLKAGSKC
jgi:hypothetical protein